MNYFTHNINDSSLSGCNVSLVNLSDLANIEKERERNKERQRVWGQNQRLIELGRLLVSVAHNFLYSVLVPFNIFDHFYYHLYDE